MHTNSREVIDDFLAQRRIAVIGVSRDAKDFTRALFREFVQRGYDVVPVHPSATEVEGVPAMKSVRDVQPAVDGALVMTPAGATTGVVEDCIAAGVPRIWLYKAVGAGAVNPEAVDLCDARKIPVVAGECPFMFFPGGKGFHGIHRFFRILTGTLPR
jgi:uncharacterized protein